MDSSTIASIAALAVAFFALFVAVAQVAQQYLATAANMQKCDRSVWGPMPGHSGRRIWTWHQLRFRIIYDMPNIFIPTEYWYKPGSARLFLTKRTTSLPSPFDGDIVDEDPEANNKRCSEACWVSFARQISQIAPAAVQVGLTLGDVDRLPADLYAVPMQVSLRDVIALGLMLGMTITNASISSLDMTGPSGCIKSSEHPLMGVLIHFSAFAVEPRSLYRGLRSGDMSRSWLHRLQGVATIAQRSYNEPKRDYYERLGANWRLNRKKLLTPADPTTKVPQQALDTEMRLIFVDTAGKEHYIPADECATWPATKTYLESKNIATPPFIVLGPERKAIPPKSWKALMRVFRQGNLNIKFKIRVGDYVSDDLQDMNKVGGAELSALETLIARQNETTGTPEPPPEPEPPGPEPPANSDTDLPTTPRSPENGKPPIPPPSENVSKENPRGVKIEDVSDHEAEPSTAGPLLLWRGPNEDRAREDHARPRRRRRRSSYVSIQSDDQFSIDNRQDQYPTRFTPNFVPDPLKLTFFWACQIDIELGPWATPWSYGMFKQADDALEIMIEVELAGLGYTSKKAQAQTQQDSTPLESGLEYVVFPENPTLKDLWLQLRDGNHSWPPYAINARGGHLDPSPHKLIQLAAFPDGELLPPLLLLQSVQEAITKETRSANPRLVRDQNLELTSIDYWLSHAATCPSIAGSRSNLLFTVPGIVEELWARFGDSVMRIGEEKWSRDAGDSEIQTLAKRMSDVVERLVGSPAEQFFVWVALLRATKVMLCIRDGPYTWHGRGLFDDDILVYMA